MFNPEFDVLESQCGFVELAAIRTYVGLQSCLPRIDFPWAEIAFTEQAIDRQYVHCYSTFL